MYLHELCNPASLYCYSSLVFSTCPHSVYPTSPSFLVYTYLTSPGIMSTTLHRNPPFRAEHLGSLLRTDKLLEARHAWESGKGSEAALKPIEDQDVKDIVKIQQDLGFRESKPLITTPTICVCVVKLTFVCRWHHRRRVQAPHVLGDVLART